MILLSAVWAKDDESFAQSMLTYASSSPVSSTDLETICHPSTVDDLLIPLMASRVTEGGSLWNVVSGTGAPSVDAL